MNTRKTVTPSSYVSLCLQRGQGPSRKKIQPQPQLPHTKEEKASHLCNHSCDMTVKPDTGNIHAYTVTSAFLHFTGTASQ